LLVSIIIATYNSEKTLKKCLDSIVNQSNKNFEILVKDGGSVDHTIKILSDYQSKFKFFATGKDNGVYDAWNICLDKCIGDWIIFLGSDDYFIDDNFLKKIQPYLNKGLFDNSKIIHGKNQIIDATGREISTLGQEIPNTSKNFFEKMPIRHPGCFHHKSLFTEVGKFDSNFKIIGDYQFILRAAKSSNFLFYPFVGVIHTNGGISTNPNYVLNIINENIKMRRQFNIKPYFNLNIEMSKRVIILIIMKLFGKYMGEKIIHFITFAKN
jgi:glycosyltransferase involved in cell wall biosynthesis